MVWNGMGYIGWDGCDWIESDGWKGRMNRVVRICLDQMDMIRSDKVGWDEMSWMD